MEPGEARIPREAIVKAVEAAERAARAVIESRLGVRLGDYRVIVKASEGEGGRLDVSVEVTVTAAKAVPRDVVDAIVEEAVRSARRAFEEVALRHARRGQGGSESSYSAERGS